MWLEGPLTRHDDYPKSMPARWSTIAIASITLVLAACQPPASISGSAEKQAKLADVLAREQSLKTQLQGLSTAAAHCPPGYIAEGERSPSAAAEADGKLSPLSAKDMGCSVFSINSPSVS